MISKSLMYIEFWEDEMIKDIFFWYLFAGFITIIKVIPEVEKEKSQLSIKSILLSSVKIYAFIEFFVSTYNFSLVKELFFVPVITSVVLLYEFSKQDIKYKITEVLFEKILMLIGFFLIYLTYKYYSTNISQIDTLSLIKSFILPIILSILFIPILYSICLYSSYENILCTLSIGKLIRGERLIIKKVKAFTLLLFKFGLRLFTLREFHNRYRSELYRVSNYNELALLLKK
jgi:hypothetical protein